MLIRILLVSCFLFLGIFLGWRYFSAPINPSATTAQIFTIPQGQPIDTIAKRLQDAGLIRSRYAFKLLVLGRNMSQKIQAGSFRLKPSMSLSVLTDQLTHGSLDIWVTLLEGWRREEMAQALVAEFTTDSSFDLTEFLRLTAGQEGYLFPDTYLLPRDASAAAVAKILTDTFAKKVDFSTNQSGLTQKQVVILASLVEREVRTDADRALVAGILIKRLDNDWPLQVDATVQYITGRSGDWWPQDLTKADIALKSPYNTYQHPGLPPAPIANPGLASIAAVLNPKASDSWFYLSDLEGRIHYAATIEEHNANIARYLTK